MTICVGVDQEAVAADRGHETWVRRPHLKLDAVNTAIHLRYRTIDENSSVTPEVVVTLWRERFEPDQKFGTALPVRGQR